MESSMGDGGGILCRYISMMLGVLQEALNARASSELVYRLQGHVEPEAEVALEADFARHAP